MPVVAGRFDGFNTTIVSVERDKRAQEDAKYELFQYNYCFGGTIKPPQEEFGGETFQYNYCFGGTKN